MFLFILLLFLFRPIFRVVIFKPFFFWVKGLRIMFGLVLFLVGLLLLLFGLIFIVVTLSPFFWLIKGLRIMFGGLELFLE